MSDQTKAVPFRIQFASGCARTCDSIVYAEGQSSVFFPVRPRSGILYLPHNGFWASEMPDFIKDRREIVIERIRDASSKYTWIKLLDAPSESDLGPITYLEEKSKKSKVFGNPSNRAYLVSDEILSKSEEDVVI